MLNAALAVESRFTGTRSLMVPERWNRLRAAIAAAREAPPAKRDSVLVRACAGQPTLLSQARSMIRAAEDTNGFLLGPLTVSDASHAGEGIPAPEERWQRIITVVEAALAYDAAAQPHFLDQMCAGDPELRSEVELLLAVYTPAAPLLGSMERIGPFRLIRRLGAGGMGEVFLAEDSRLRRNVALKFVRPELAGDSERLWRFEREALAAAALNHPNVATVYEVGEADGRRYIAMEYVEGISLAAHIKQRSLGLREAIAIAIEVADALQEAHAKGIVHRDVKPSNVMVTPRGHAKVLDFGVAKLGTELDPMSGASDSVTRGTSASGLLGTAGYMSPEQAEGMPVDARSDIFCFGVTLYEMATGRLPFGWRVQASKLATSDDAEPAPVSHHNPSLPARFDRLVSRCLQKDRERRYPTAHDLLADLRAVQQSLDDGLGIAAQPGLFREEPKRRAVVRAAMALVAGTFVVCAGRR